MNNQSQMKNPHTDSLEKVLKGNEKNIEGSKRKFVKAKGSVIKVTDFLYVKAKDNEWKA